MRPCSLATRNLRAAARAHWASAEAGRGRVHPLDLCVMVRRLVTVSVLPLSWQLACVSSQRGPESTLLALVQPPATSICHQLSHGAGGAEEGVGEARGRRGNGGCPKYSPRGHVRDLNFVICDQLKAHAPPGATLGESTLTRELGIRKEQKGILILNDPIPSTGIKQG